MNRFTIVTVIFVAFMFVACHDSREDVSTPRSEKDVYKTIGEQIPFETGMQWIDLYKSGNSGQGRLDLLPYHIPATQLDSMILSTEDLTGIAFHHAIDSLGQAHILAIPVNSSLRLWGSGQGRIFIDANSGSQIDESVALAWAQNYKSDHPSGIWFHFFGRDIFDEIRALPHFENIDIQPATSTLDLSPQMLLIIWNGDYTTNGRTSSESGIVYDASNACPPCAVE
jgi:hypothetical protein